MQQKKRVWEIKCTCRSCGNIWFYGKQEVKESEQADVNAYLERGCFPPGCLSTLTSPNEKVNEKVISFGNCPKCGSGDITKEVETHEV